MSSVLDLIENKGLLLDSTDYYAAILGESPSKGARSPLLWNAAFKKLNISAVMHPMDISANNIKAVIQNLKKDTRFIGGAVTMPYKITVRPYLDAIEPEAETIGAVNCIYRDGERLVGANTDGAGAVWSMEKEVGQSIAGKKVLLLGTGGAGVAVATYIASALTVHGQLRIANRSEQSRNQIIRRLQGKCQVVDIENWPVTVKDVEGIDIVINCTSIGFEAMKRDEKGVYYLKYFTPLGDIENMRVKEKDNAEKEYILKASSSVARNVSQSIKIMASLNKPFVFDIIYQPRMTMLLSLAQLIGSSVLNGKPMNLEQAVIAFVKAAKACGLFRGEHQTVREVMAQA